MIKNWSLAFVLLAYSKCAWAIYGPSLTRADRAVALRACQEANFAQGQEIAKAVRSGKPTDILGVLGDALKEWRGTPSTSVLYPARAFCIHEIVPNRLPSASSDLATQRLPTLDVTRFRDLGLEYFYYGPDGEWTLREDPVDLNELAIEHLDFPWGRQAFLMMTRLGWSQGACQEGPDQFREVIKHGEKFLKEHPKTEVSNSIRLELANAYATWWNVSRMESDAYSNPENYEAGAPEAKQRATKLYEEYLRAKRASGGDVQVEKRLKALLNNPKGSDEYDYFCEDYED
jgi:hypothetical protein